MSSQCCRKRDCVPRASAWGLARLWVEAGNRHVTAEDLYAEAKSAGISVSLATIYNTLHQFTECGLLREVIVEPGRAYFDTNTSGHHHFFFEETGDICDIPANEIAIARLPSLPDGATLNRSDVAVRVTGGQDKK